MNSPVEFIAEVKETKSYKSASGDMTYRLVVITEDPKLMALGLLDGHTLIKLTVEVAE